MINGHMPTFSIFLLLFFFAKQNKIRVLLFASCPLLNVFVAPQCFSSKGRVVASKRVILKPQYHLLSTATPLTCNNSTLPAKTLCFDTLFKLSF